MYIYYIQVHIEATVTFENNQKLMSLKSIVLPVFYQLYTVTSKICQKWNRNPQAGGGSLTIEICMGRNF